MNEQQPKEDFPGFLIKIAHALHVEPETLADMSKNYKNLFQRETWKEIASELPKRVKISIVLIVVLIMAVLWGQSALSSSPSLAVKIALPKQAVQSVSSPTPIVVETPASLISTSAVVPAKTTPTPAPTVTPAPTPTPLFMFHTVQADETLISIAAHYQITTETLMAANNIRNPSELHEAQHLLIPSENEFSGQKMVVHEAAASDSLLNIASKYGSSVIAIQAANPQLEDSPPTEGEAVAVPIVFEKDNLAITPNETGETLYHTIQPGDIPLAIAAQYDIPVEILLTTNNITDVTRLQVGQQLAIPPHDGLSVGYPVILYELTENDTLVGIASRFGSSVKDMLSVNIDLDPAKLEIGQIVAIPVIFKPQKTFAPAPSSPLGTPVPVPPPPQIPALFEEMLAAVNTERETRGLPPYQQNNNLTAVALGHAQDMVVRDFVAHINPDGLSPRDRILADGISNFNRAGENIQLNGRPENETVAAAVDWFMNSPPHRAGILNKYYNQIGVAAVHGPGVWFTFVLVFAER